MQRRGWYDLTSIMGIECENAMIAPQIESERWNESDQFFINTNGDNSRFIRSERFEVEGEVVGIARDCS